MPGFKQGATLWLFIAAWLLVADSAPVAADSAAIPSATSLSPDQINAILMTPAPGGRDLTVDDFMSRLPESYRRGYTLMYRSMSSQMGTPENPRQIFYGSDAKAMITVSSDPKDSEFQSVEMMTWDEAKGQFVMRSIPFPRKPGPLSAVPTNPQECLNCHNMPPRPNWAPHNSWPGAYCSTGRKFKDGTCINDTEAQAYRKYDATRATGARSKYLPTLTKAQIDTLASRKGEDPDPAAYAKDYQICANGVGIDPNSKLSELASELNFKKILRQLKDTPSFSKYKYSFAAVALGCTDTCIEGRASTLPCAKADGAKAPMGVEDMLSTGERSKGKTRADLVADTTQTMTAQFTARTADLHATNDPTDAQAPDRCSDSDYDKSRGAVNFDLTDAKLVATTRYLTERMGVNMSEWSMAASNGEFSYASGIDGIDRVYQLYLLEQLKNPDPGLPKLGSYLKINKSEAGEVPGRVGVDFTGTAADKARLCESLKERSLKAFGGEAGKCPDPGGQPVPKQTEEDIEKARNATFGL